LLQEAIKSPLGAVVAFGSIELMKTLLEAIKFVEFWVIAKVSIEITAFEVVEFFSASQKLSP
jgi:hypothetical protein